MQVTNSFSPIKCLWHELADYRHKKGDFITADPLFPSVSVMLCSHFFQFSKQKVFDLNFLQFLNKRKTFSFETKTEGFHETWKQKYALVSFTYLFLLRLELGLGKGWVSVQPRFSICIGNRSQGWILVLVSETSLSFQNRNFFFQCFFFSKVQSSGCTPN